MWAAAQITGCSSMQVLLDFEPDPEKPLKFCPCDSEKFTGIKPGDDYA